MATALLCLFLRHIRIPAGLWKTAMPLLMVVCSMMGYSPELAIPARATDPPKTASNAPRNLIEEEKVRTDRYGDPLPEGALARLGTIRFRQGFLTNAVSFSPDGKTIACAAAGRGVCLWDMATGKELRQFGKGTHAYSIAFSPDGKVLACAIDTANGGKSALYETASGREIAELPRGLRSLAYAPDGKTLAAVFGSGSAIHLFDTATGKKQKPEPSSDKEEISRLVWSPDGKKLAWVCANGSIHLWDAIKGKEIGQWKGHDKAIYALAISPDGKTLATSSQDETIRLWNVATHKERCTLQGKYPFGRALAFSRDGRLLASGHGDGTIALWDTAKGKEIRRRQAHVYTVMSLDFAPDNKTLVSGAAWECGPRLWNVATGKEVRPFAGHTSVVDRVLFSSDGHSVYSVGRDKKILHWNLADGCERLRFQLPFHVAARPFDPYAFSPQGDMVASWSHKDDTIRLWDGKTGRERHTLGKFVNNRNNLRVTMEFSPDGRLLAFAGTDDRVVHVWDAVAGVPRIQLKGLEGEVRFLTFSHDGKRVAAGATSVRGSLTIALWDVKTGKSPVKFANLEAVDSLALSPDGTILASASMEKVPRLWDVTTGHALPSLVDAPRLYPMVFSPDGKWLAGADAYWDQKIHVWEVITGLEARSFPGHNGGVISVAFASNGRTLVSGGGDSSILMWDFTGRVKDGRQQTVKWTPAQLEERWKDLASKEGPQAAQAIWDLVADAERSVSLIRQRIKPVATADAQRVERLIDALDSDDFPTRTKATEELGDLVESAEPTLRKKLTDKPPLEMRRRIEQILVKLEPGADVARLRALRAVQVLEYIGTTESKKCLETLAKGLPEVRLTREAKASLCRLSEKNE